MTKHYIFNLDPAAKYEWDRCTLRDPITADHPALASLVAEAVGKQPGSYLVAVSIEVKVLEQAEIDRSSYSLPVEMPTRSPVAQLAERVA